MPVNVVGLFDTVDQAQFAVRQLLANGFNSADISVVAADPSGTVRREIVQESGDMVSEGAVSGATSGILVGGLVGLLVGATVLTVPPAGLLIAGPLAGFLTGAGVGMVSGGILGALIGLGIPEEEAHIYAESVRRGSMLVSVSTTEASRLIVEQILGQAGAVNVAERRAAYRQLGFSAYDPNAPIYTPEQVAAERSQMMTAASVPAEPIPPVAASPDDLPLYVPDDLFTDDYWANFSPLGISMEAVRPAYQFGYRLANKPEFRHLDWSTMEPQARRLWEQDHPGTWDTFRNAIHIGWSKALTSVTGVMPTRQANLF